MWFNFLSFLPIFFHRLSLSANLTVFIDISLWFWFSFHGLIGRLNIFQICVGCLDFILTWNCYFNSLPLVYLLLLDS